MQQRGYIEGYYGRLLSWQARQQILAQVHQCGMRYYWYAPKEDTCHRLHWREPYPSDWVEAFSRFGRAASEFGVDTIAGVAPGLDFDFSCLSRSYSPSDHLAPDGDFTSLVAKTQIMLNAGATIPALLLDDIDADFSTRSGEFASEGLAHAELANRLGDRLQQPLWVVPRIYANELAPETPQYLPDFLSHLDNRHTVVYCGSHIVASEVRAADCFAGHRSAHAVVFWDNLYANDYCPRQLYLGPWRGRTECETVLLNPTGMPQTDQLLLRIMQMTGDHEEREFRWRKALLEAGVPEAFFSVAEFFDRPPDPADLSATLYTSDPARLPVQLHALETLLWRWKSPLAREWYPYLMNLKHDLQLAHDELAYDRLLKTQPRPLASRLLSLQ